MEISALAAVGSVLLAALTTAVVVFFKYLLPNIKGGGTFLKNCVGVPENKKTGQTFVPSIFERFDAQDENLERQNAVLADIVQKVTEAVGQVDKAVQQVANSHVTNLRDDVDEVIGKVDSLHDKVDALVTPSNGQTTTININPEGTL
jgi:hypothetical protein